MPVTADRIAVLAPRIDRQLAKSMAAAFAAAAPAFGVSGVLRVGHFMGQTCHESAGFTRLEENLNYLSADRIAKVWPRLAPRAASLVGNKQALANAAYAGRNGNGGEASGDGWLYRGRGLIHLTGRANYAAAGKMIGLDLVGDPDQLLETDPAVRAALAFWKSSGCNGAADMDDCEGVTRIITGPRMEGLEPRRDLTERAKRIFV
jgi:putative chitinase